MLGSGLYFSNLRYPLLLRKNKKTGRDMNLKHNVARQQNKKNKKKKQQTNKQTNKQTKKLYLNFESLKICLIYSWL